MNQTDSIRIFLQKKTHADLAELYSDSMEVQVNVAQDGGTRIQGEFKGRHWQGYTDGVQTWKPFRIPRNANSTPEYEPKDMKFDIFEHAEGIGMTGWDWKNLCSRWVAFDFDAITGHSDKHGRKMSEEELVAVRDSTQALPWVTVRKSSGGKGLHLYVFLDPAIPTKNHNEHAALARAILGKMTALTGFDFEAKVDICGQNMWVWHRKQTLSNGLELIKKGESLGEVPINWKEHIKVISGHRKKTLPRFVEQVEGASELEKMFIELTSQSARVPLDEEHKKLLKYLESKGTSGWFDADHHMLVTHTFYLKQAHTDLGLRGIFDTNAQGSEAPTDHNCFCFPLTNGGWAVRRYSVGVAEHPSWEQDSKGWTRCFLNRQPDLSSAARSLGGVEDPSGGFMFKEAEIARDAAVQIGARVPELPVGLRGRRTTLKAHRDGRLIVEIEAQNDDAFGDSMSGWLNKKGKWSRIFSAQTSVPSEADITSFDDSVRHVVTEIGTDFGWLIKTDGTHWREEPLTHVKMLLESMNYSAKDVKMILGTSVLKCWRMVNKPFQPEYPGDRQWNRDGAQFRYLPSFQKDELLYPHWTMILKHCGAGLDDAIQNNGWAKVNGIESGADYLKIWLASIFKEPLEPLPYLFLYGPQNSGKSILHEAVGQLTTRGYHRADNALINQSGFNAELRNAILCVIEEIDLRKNKEASNRIKDWVTARQLPIHEKGKTPYEVKNSTHWIQCANDRNSCPIFPGDTRITMIHVPEIGPEQMIPKSKMFMLLEREASDFLAELLRLEIPPSNDRLNVPVIKTAEKLDVELANQTALELFLKERCFQVDGEKIKFSDLYDAFIRYIDPNEAVYWTKKRFSREMPPHFPKGRSRQDGQWFVGNICFDRKPVDKPKLRTIIDANENVYLETENGNGQTNP